MTKSPVPFLDYILLGPYIAFANVYFGGIVSEKSLLYAIAVRKINYIAHAEPAILGTGRSA